MQTNSNSLSSYPETAPLKAWQKARLLYDCVPVVAFLLLCIIYFTVLRDLIGAPPLLMLLFMTIVILVLGFQAVQRLRDLVSGTVRVQDDVLLNSHRSSGSGRMFFANFEGLGKLRIMPKAHFQSHNGARYRVYYSPISKIVWTLEPLDYPYNSSPC